jgi:MFS family permease
VVAWLLAGRAVGFPTNLALLVLLCGCGVMVSWFFLAALREPPVERKADGATPARVESFAAYLRSFPARFRERPFLARLAAVQILAQTGGACVPFLLPAGAGESGLPGILLAVQTVGLMAFAPVWGGITDRRGPRLSLLGHFVVGLALCAAAIASLAPGPLALPLLFAAYFLFGGIMDAWATATNYQLEALPEGEQATYIGLMNAATAPTLLLPLVAGAVATAFGKLPLFLLAAALLLAGLLLARTLPDTRARHDGG